MKRQTLYLLLAIIVVMSYLLTKVTSEPNTYTTLQFYPSFTDSSLVSHNFYKLVYNEQHEQADWVAYSVLPGYSEARFKRRNIFRIDTLVSSHTASDRDYYKSGFDRGHLVPAGDMSFDSIALEESFYYSNISPQLAGFNRGVWRSLETHVRALGASHDSLIVFTGPVFMGDSDPIGENKVSVPGYFYKIIIKFSTNQISTASYLIPHQQGLKSYADYQVSIDEIEKVTGLDFLNQLPNRLEEKLER